MHSAMSTIGTWVKTRPICRAIVRTYRMLTRTVVLEDIPVLDRLVIAEDYRQGTLKDLSAGATAMGLLLALTAPEIGPSFAIFGQLPGWPWLWGFLLAIFGLAQWVGVSLDKRFLSTAGCAAASVWYLLFGIIFAATWGHWTWDYFVHGARVPNPSVYPTAIYVMAASMHLRAVSTLRYYLAAERRQVARTQEG